MTASERIKNFMDQQKDSISGARPQANHEDWRFSPDQLWEDLTSLQEPLATESLTGESVSFLKDLESAVQFTILNAIESAPWESPLPFLQVMDSRLEQAIVVRVRANSELSTPISLDLSYRRVGNLPTPLIVLFETGSKGRIILKSYGTTPVVESLRIICEAQSHGFVDILEKTEGTWAIFEQAIVGDNAHLTHTFLSLGHGIKRRDTTMNMVGNASTAIARSAYLGRFNDSKELLIRQRHTGEKSISLVLEKGVAADSAYNVLNGIIQVRPKAAGSEAYLTNNNLLLNDGVRSHSIPRLEIEENDVKCSHSSTASFLDSIQIFYLMSRGLSEGESRQILTESFLEESLVDADSSLVEELAHIFC